MYVSDDMCIDTRGNVSMFLRSDPRDSSCLHRPLSSSLPAEPTRQAQYKSNHLNTPVTLGHVHHPLMYSSSSASSFSPHTLPFLLPLDPDLQGTSLQPLGRLQFNTPFGDLTFEKTRRTLALPTSEENDQLKLTALKQLLELLSRPQKVQILLDQGVFAELVLNAPNDNQDVRILATAALSSLTGSRAGRDFALSADICPRLSKLSSSQSESCWEVRTNVLQTFLHLTSSQAGIAHIIKRGLVEQLVGAVGGESVLRCRAQTLEILTIVLRDPQGWKVASEAGLVPMVAKVMRTMLADPDTLAATESVITSGGIIATKLKPLFQTISLLAKVVAYISAVALQGKNECVACEIVPMLVSLLAHPVASIRIDSTLALQNLTNCESGKKAALAADILQPLLDACSDPDEMVQCQSMQSLTNMAEHPVAKADPRVVAAVEELTRARDTSRSDKVRHAAKLAIQQITWQP